MEHFEGFELVEEEHDYIVVDKDQSGHKRHIQTPILHADYEKLLHQHKIVSTQLNKMVYSLEKSGLSGNNRDLWLDAANSVIKCMADVILEGEKLVNNL
jgi:hypothetical protein